LVAAGVVFAGLLAPPARVAGEVSPQSCSAASDLAKIDLPLSRLARRVAEGEPVKIVAIGSSSTSGAGASSSAYSYPSRLESELKVRFPNLSIVVLNRCVNGEEAPQMLARFAQAVVAEKPDLVLWQVGTNSVLRNQDTGKFDATLREGIERLKAFGVDVILVDLQFAPRVIEKPTARDMVARIAVAAKRYNVGLFHRFAVMEYWNEIRHVSFRQSLSPDGLHMNDWSYGCIAKLLASAIADASNRIPQTARVPVAHR
jgi:lysophospholipase L1-like esterase